MSAGTQRHNVDIGGPLTNTHTHTLGAHEHRRQRHGHSATSATAATALPNTTTAYQAAGRRLYWRAVREALHRADGEPRGKLPPRQAWGLCRTYPSRRAMDPPSPDCLQPAPRREGIIFRRRQRSCGALAPRACQGDWGVTPCSAETHGPWARQNAPRRLPGRKIGTGRELKRHRNALGALTWEAARLRNTSPVAHVVDKGLTPAPLLPLAATATRSKRCKTAARCPFAQTPRDAKPKDYAHVHTELARPARTTMHRRHLHRTILAHALRLPPGAKGSRGAHQRHCQPSSRSQPLPWQQGHHWTNMPAMTHHMPVAQASRTLEKNATPKGALHTPARCCCMTKHHQAPIVGQRWGAPSAIQTAYSAHPPGGASLRRTPTAAHPKTPTRTNRPHSPPPDAAPLSLYAGWNHGRKDTT